MNVGSRSRTVIVFDDREYVDDGRGRMIKSSPCKFESLELPKELCVGGGRTDSRETHMQDWQGVKGSLLYQIWLEGDGGFDSVDQ